MTEIEGQDYVVCPLCNEHFLALNAHLPKCAKKKGMSLEEAKQKYPNMKMVCDKTAKSHSKAIIKELNKPEVKEKQREAQIGKHPTEATLEKLRAAKTNEKHPMWKGDDCSYETLLDWIRYHKPKPEFCEICHKVPPVEVANISGEYKRNINDFMWTCRSCNCNMGIPIHPRFIK